MVKFIDADGKAFAVSKETVTCLKDVSSSQRPVATQITAGGVSFTVAQSVDDIVAALNA